MLSSSDARNLVIEKYNNNHMERLTHIFGVAEMAEELALKYDVDSEKALIAAYMHDYSKYDDPAVAIGVFTDEEINECRRYPFLFHAYMSAYKYKEFAKDDFDIDIYNAIRNHVFGRVGMSNLEEIVMISDYTEKNRKYPTCIECRKILLAGNKDLAIYKALSYTIDHAVKKGEVAHPEQIKVREIYRKKLGL